MSVLRGAIRSSTILSWSSAAFVAVAMLVFSACGGATDSGDAADESASASNGDELHDIHHGDDGHDSEHEHHHGDDGHADEDGIEAARRTRRGAWLWRASRATSAGAVCAKKCSSDAAAARIVQRRFDPAVRPPHSHAHARPAPTPAQ